MMSRLLVAPALLLSLLLVLPGCGRSPSPTLYTLETPRSDTAQPTKMAESYTLGLRKIALPAVLKRPQIVLIENEQVKALELHRWSEPLDAAILRIMASELRVRLDTASILPYPWPNKFNPEQTLTVSVTHFSGLPGKEVELSGVWILTTVDGRHPLKTEQFSFVEKVEGNNYSDLVRAHASALNQLIAQVANSLSSVD